MSISKSVTAIVPSADLSGSLLFRFSPATGLQCYANGTWYTVSGGDSSEESGSYSFQSPLSVDANGTVFLESAIPGASNGAGKPVVTDSEGKIPEELLPELDTITWVDLT